MWWYTLQIILFFNCTVVVNVRFGMETYSVDEGTKRRRNNTIVVDLILSNPSSEAISFDIQSKDVTATGMSIYV